MKYKTGVAIGIVALVLVIVILLIAISGCNGDDEPEVPPETKLEKGLDLEKKTAGWAVTQALPKAREWRENAKLIYLEWRNLDADGIMGEGDTVYLYFSSEWAEKYYRVIVDQNGASDYDLGEVARSEVFTENQDAVVFNWTKDSDYFMKKAKGLFIKDSEEFLRFIVTPAKTTELEMNSNLAIVVIYTTEQDIFYNGNTGVLLHQDIVLKPH